jgi:hypothetical protein
MCIILTWMTREDRIGNEYVRGSVDVALIVDKMWRNKLWWACDKTRGNKRSKSGYEN